MSKGILTASSFSTCPRVSPHSFLLNVSKGIHAQLSFEHVQGYHHTAVFSTCPRLQPQSSSFVKSTQHPRVSLVSFIFNMSKGTLTQLPLQHVQGYPHIVFIFNKSKGITTQLSLQHVQGYPRTAFASTCPRVSSHSFLLSVPKGILTQRGQAIGIWEFLDFISFSTIMQRLPSWRFHGSPDTPLGSMKPLLFHWFRKDSVLLCVTEKVSRQQGKPLGRTFQRRSQRRVSKRRRFQKEVSDEVAEEVSKEGFGIVIRKNFQRRFHGSGGHEAIL